MSKINNIVSYTISVPKGVRITLTVPTDIRTGQGFFPTSKPTVLIDGSVEVPTVYGFAVRNSSVGKLEANTDSINAGVLSVFYTQLLSKENTIYFFADTGEQQNINVIIVPIHDHSSIYQGGPAFGTFASAFVPGDEEPAPNT